MSLHFGLSQDLCIQRGGKCDLFARTKFACPSFSKPAGLASMGCTYLNLEMHECRFLLPLSLTRVEFHLYPVASCVLYGTWGTERVGFHGNGCKGTQPNNMESVCYYYFNRVGPQLKSLSLAGGACACAIPLCSTVHSYPYHNLGLVSTLRYSSILLHVKGHAKG